MLLRKLVFYMTKTETKPYPTRKSNSKWLGDLNRKSETLTLLVKKNRKNSGR
jgi:hypothetical protein